MCPSFQATREEKDSTRGRANLLRLAITGQLGFSGFTDPHVHDVLDLCLECKACKGECPTNVDMARLKAEFLHQYYREHRLPLRNLFFGHVAELGRIGSALAPVSNWLGRSGPSRWLNEKLLGIDRRRVPPAFARRSLVKRFRVREDEAFDGAARTEPRPPERTEDEVHPPVLLLPDTFTNYFEPEVGEAAIEVLRRVGRAVTLGPPGLRCCGRPLISNGLLDEAVANARHNVELLYGCSRQGNPITACEPSCILTIRDDYPALLRGELRARAESVAGACLTLEELLDPILAGEAVASPSMKPGLRRILAHAHCHQRSLIGVEPMLRMLRSIPGAEVIDLDAGCCGMAGSFGYEVEHYEVSKRVGEQRLLPVVRRAGRDDVIVAPGFSCRLQVRHFTGREAIHPAVLMRSCLT
jgi:Fe-S oxidoreductase